VTIMRWDAAAKRERKRVCVHEAAHAVVAILKGSSTSVRLIIRRNADDLFFSGCVTERSRTPGSALVAAAGFVGEEKFCAARGWSGPPEAASERDMWNVDEAVGQDERAGMYDERALALERARATLDDPEVWFAVLALAAALNAHWPDAEAAAAVGPGEFVGEMSAAAVAATCAQAGQHARGA